MATGQITRIRGATTASVSTITQIRGASALGRQSRITRIRGGSTGPLIIDANLSQTVDPFEIVRLTITVVASAAPIDTYSWVQTGGPLVTLTPVNGDPTSVTFQAPAALDGVVLNFQATATVSGQSATDSTTVTVTPHTGLWTYRGAVLTGIQILTDVSNVLIQPTPSDTVYSDIYGDTF